VRNLRYTELPVLKPGLGGGGEGTCKMPSISTRQAHLPTVHNNSVIYHNPIITEANGAALSGISKMRSKWKERT